MPTTQKPGRSTEDNPAAGKDVGVSQEIGSRVDVQEERSKTFATREWVYHRFIAFAAALLLLAFYFIRDIFSNIFNVLLQLSGSNGFY